MPRHHSAQATTKKDNVHVKDAAAKEGPNSQSLGIYDTSSVRARISKWQALNEFDVPPAESLSAEAGTKTLPTKKRPYQVLDAALPKAGAVKPSAAQALNKDYKEHERSLKELSNGKAVAAPKKRLVSDEHWKNRRGACAHDPDALKKNTHLEPASRPARTKPDAWVKPKSSPVKSWEVKPLNDTGLEASPGKSGNLQLRSPNKSDGLHGPDSSLVKSIIDKDLIKKRTNDSGERDTKNPREILNAAQRDHAPHDPNSPPKNDYHPALQFFAGRPIPDPLPKDEKKQPQEKKPVNLRPALQFLAGKPPPRQPNLVAAQPHNRPKEDVLPIAKNAKTAGPGSSPDPLDRIQAWLGDSPDPFTDSKPPKETTTTQYQNAPISDAPENEEERRKRRERRKPRRQSSSPDRERSAGNRTVQQDLDNTSSSSKLKRSGAKRNQRSPRTHRHSPTPSALEPQSAVPASFLGDLQSLAPDDSASMLGARPEPTTSKASGDFLSSRRTPGELHSNSLDASKALVPTKIPSGKRRKITSQTDLLSVLSEVAPPGPRNLISACSLRSARSRPGETTASELIAEVKVDEEKYDGELRILIDGVIPVLLNSVISKSAEPTVAPLFSSNTHAVNATTPIVSMGVALERLRSIHKRLPLTTADALVNWASQAHRVYADYIKAWRLGFQDVVVNLAPAERDASGIRPQAGLNIDQDGNGSNHMDKKVDVAHLLKRPLVRLKHLAKTFKGLHIATGSSQAREWADKYHTLVEAARVRQNEERARLEDEAAAAIDATRTRDPQTLAPLAGVKIDQRKCVRARDFFDLRLHHSTAQRLDCHVELILRDDAHGNTSGDILFCEVESTSRWLLFPPLRLECISARSGETAGEIVAMIRSNEHSRLQWSEVISLYHEDHQACTDWLSMLGTLPVPPQSFTSSESLSSKTHEGYKPSMLALPEPTPWRSVEQHEIHVPFGEQASSVSRRWTSPPSSAKPRNRSTPLASSADRLMLDTGSPTATPKDMNRPRHSTTIDQRSKTPLQHRQNQEPQEGSNDDISTPSQAVVRPRASHLPDEFKTPERPSSQKDYDRMRRFARREELSDIASHTAPSPDSFEKSPSTLGSASAAYVPRTTLLQSHVRDFGLGRPASHVSGGNESSTVSQLPRDVESPHSPRVARQEQDSMSLQGQGAFSSGTKPLPKKYPVEDFNKSLPRSSANASPKASNPSTSPATGETSNALNTVQSEIKASKIDLNPQYLQTSPGRFGHRRSSSPLKHEYAPSTASEDSAKGEILSDDEEDAMSFSSASSAEDIVPSLPPVNVFARRKKGPDSVYTSKNSATLSPSQSASQAPYRSVPPAPPGGEKKIASIFCWSDKGAWEPLHPDECSIVVSPGLIEAYEMSAAHSGSAKSGESSPSSPHFSQRPEGVSPLVGLELTPLVPLRRGTAIDISIRSPLTKESVLRTSTNNIMFRSRNNVECERLYNAINYARINNPTYIALQNARPEPGSSWGAYMDARANAPVSTWWRFSRRKSSYRAGSSRRTPSIAAQTHDSEASGATMASALSALRRFTAGSRMFNVAKSTITHGEGMKHSLLSRSSVTRSSTSGGHSSERAGSGASTPPAGVGLGMNPTSGSPLGINGARIRLYVRETAGRWRDLGSARLIIMQPPRPFGAPPALSPDGRLQQEKRVVIQGGHSEVVLLDVTLGESAFERVARTGIALSVWERMGEVGHKGSVLNVRVKVYMLQMKSEAEAAYTFSLVGRLRH